LSDSSVREIDVSRSMLPVKVSENLQSVFAMARKDNSTVLAIVTGTKTDF